MRYLVACTLAVCVTSAPPLSVGAAGQRSSSETATQLYLRYLATIPKAVSVDDILAFWSTPQAGEYRAAPAAERMGLDELKRMYGMVVGTQVVKETVTPLGATLDIEAVVAGKRSKGVVGLLREGAAWKVTGPEQWQN